MKFSLVLSAILANSASAFAPHSNFGVVRSTQLFNSRIDSSDAVAAALAASKKFGATSSEARVAWDIVEEMDASDNSGAYAPVINEDECLLTNSIDQPCQDYDSKIKELSVAMGNAQIHFDTIKKLGTEIQAIKIPSPPAPQAAGGIDMSKLISEAKLAGDKFGVSSTEAKMAWETVEEIASNDSSEEQKGSLDEECLVEMMTACEALDEVSRVLSLDKSSDRYGG